MPKIILQRQDRKLIDSIFEHPGNIFSVHFVGYEDIYSIVYDVFEWLKENSLYVNEIETI